MPSIVRGNTNTAVTAVADTVAGIMNGNGPIGVQSIGGMPSN
jgi:hypothetical protein